MRAPTFGTRGFFKNCVFFPWCYCSNTLLVVQKPTEFDFQLLHENPQLWWLFLHVFILGNNFILCSRGNTLASCFIVPSFFVLSITFWSGMGVFVYQDLTKSLILTFFNFWEKMEITCCLVWKQRNIAYFLTSSHVSKKLLCEEQCQGLLLLVRLDSGPFQSSRCTPKLKGDFCHYSMTYPFTHAVLNVTLFYILLTCCDA